MCSPGLNALEKLELRSFDVVRSAQGVELEGMFYFSLFCCIDNMSPV